MGKLNVVLNIENIYGISHYLPLLSADSTFFVLDHDYVYPSFDKDPYQIDYLPYC